MAALTVLPLAAVGLLGSPGVAHASKNLDIQVGIGPAERPRFKPEVLYANPGDNVTFHFVTKGHSATEATARLKDPCHALGGFDTGIQQVGAEQSIVVSTRNSIYVFSDPDCGKGMVAIINPGPNDSVDAYRKAAIRQEG
ncbi:hypothetical protein [Nocardia brasiliensis]|uniref:hypothetical protein n=1 Tax=Nocardia brasiliensis TaxID=37326 RepID=UPI003D8DB834